MKQSIVLAAAFAAALNTLSAVMCFGSDDKTVLAEVNKKKITLADFRNEINALPENYRGIIKANKEKFLEELVLQEVLYQEALKQRLDKKPETARQLEQSRKKILAQTLVEGEIASRGDVTEEEITGYYEEHKEEYAIPEQISAAHILIRTAPEATEEEKTEALKKTEELLAKLKNGEDFAALAKKFSACPSGAKGGELGMFSRGQMVPEFEAAAFSLEPGQLSAIVKTDFGYHIIKVMDKQASRTLAFDEVHDQIKQYLSVEKQKAAFEEYVEKLKSKAKIKIHENALEGI